MDASCKLQDIVDAVEVISSSDSILDMLRESRLEQERIQGETITDTLQTVEDARSGGWVMVADDNPDVDPDDTFAEAIASMVSTFDTPEASDVARYQLRGHPYSQTLHEQHSIVNACLACYARVADTLQLAQISRTQFVSGDVYGRRSAASTSAAWQDYCFCAMTHMYECGGNIQFLDVNRTRYVCSVDDSSLWHAKLDMNAWYTHLYLNGVATGSGCAGTMRMLMRKTRFGALPPDVFQMIMEYATRTRINDLHCVLDDMYRREHNFEALVFRQNLGVCLSVTIATHTLFMTGCCHLRMVRDYLSVRYNAVARLERCIARTMRQQKRMRRSKSQPSIEYEIAQRPMLNTLVVCDTHLSRHLRSAAAFANRGLTVRHLTGIPELSPAIHADIVCVNPLSIHSVHNLRFLRCIFCNPRYGNTATCNYNVHSMYRWVVKHSGSIRPVMYPLPEFEAELLLPSDSHPPSIHELEDYVVVV